MSTCSSRTKTPSTARAGPSNSDAPASAPFVGYDRLAAGRAPLPDSSVRRLAGPDPGDHTGCVGTNDPGSGGAAMIITLVIDTFNVNNNGTTVSAMRFAATLIARGHTVRVVACGGPGDATEHGPERPEMFWVPELVVPIASRLAH